MNIELKINIDKRQIHFNYHTINFSLWKGRIVFDDNIKDISCKRLTKGILKELNKPINLKTKKRKGF